MNRPSSSGEPQVRANRPAPSQTSVASDAPLRHTALDLARSPTGRGRARGFGKQIRRVLAWHSRDQARLHQRKTRSDAADRRSRSSHRDPGCPNAADVGLMLSPGAAAPRRARQAAWRQAPESPQTTAPRPPYPPAARDDRWIQARCTTWRLEVLGSRVLFGASAAPVSWPYDHEMTNVKDIEDLRHPDAAKLLHTPDPARLAYNGPDGFPRVIPIGFLWNGTAIVVCTAVTAPKVKALRERPNVALTIDDIGPPAKALLVRGVANVEIVDGVASEYLAAAAKSTHGDELGWRSFQRFPASAANGSMDCCTPCRYICPPQRQAGSRCVTTAFGRF